MADFTLCRKCTKCLCLRKESRQERLKEYFCMRFVSILPLEAVYWLLCASGTANRPRASHETVEKSETHFSQKPENINNTRASRELRAPVKCLETSACEALSISSAAKCTVRIFVRIRRQGATKTTACSVCIARQHARSSSLQLRKTTRPPSSNTFGTAQNLVSSVL